MSSAAEVANVEETVHLSVIDSATRDEHVADRSANADRNRNPFRHRVFKTVCLYVSFGTMVRTSVEMCYLFVRVLDMPWMATNQTCAWTGQPPIAPGRT